MVIDVRYLRGDLSAPVLAILVTIGIIAAGLILLAWFWWFAPYAGKTGSISILGTPSITSAGTLYLSVRNTGNDAVVITGVTVNNVACSYNDDTSLNITVQPGESRALVLTCPNAVPQNARTVNGVVITNYGTYQFTASVL